MAQHVLRQANNRPREEPCNRASSRHRKEDRYQQWKVEINGKSREAKRDERLQKQRQQRHSDRHRNAEPVDLNLLLGCVRDGHAIVGCSRKVADSTACPVRPALAWLSLPRWKVSEPCRSAWLLLAQSCWQLRWRVPISEPAPGSKRPFQRSWQAVWQYRESGA